MYIAGIGNIEKLGDLTDEQRRQIAASSHAGISDSVRAAQAAGAASDAKSLEAAALSSYIASLPASVGGGLQNHAARNLLIIAGVGVALYLLMRRRPARVLHSRRRKAVR